MNKKLKRKQALIMAEPYRTPFNSKVAKVSGDVIEDSVGGIKYATSFNGATKIVDGNKNKIKIKDGVYSFGKSVNLLEFDDVENVTADNGITYSIKDGVITFSATPSETIRNVTLHFNPISINVGDNYSIALFNQFTSPIGFFVQDKSNSGEANQYLGIDENIATTWTVNAGSVYEAIVFYLDTNKTYTNEVIKPILVSGSTIPTKYYSGSYGIKIEVADGVMTCNGILASDSEQNWWYNFELPISSGIYSANMFLRSSNINVYLSQDLTDWDHSYQIAVQEASTAPLSNINIKTDCTYMFFNFDREHDYENVILKPMLVLGTTAPTEFEPNFKNLLEIGDLSERTKEGLTYYYKNGMIVVNGTSNGGYTHIYDNLLGAEDFEDGATYSFNDISNNNNLYLQFSLAKKDGTTQYLTKKNSFIWDSNIYSICYIAVQTAPTITKFNNIVIKPTLVKSSIIPSQFIPFANPYFVSLGQNGSVQYNGLEPREIDLKGNVISKINNQASDKLSNYALTKNTKVVDLGSLTWEATDKTVNNKYRMSSQSLKSEIVYSSSSSSVGNIISTTYNSLSTNDTYLEKKGISLETDGTIKIYDPEYNTSDKLEAFKKAIRGTLLMYQVKNPTTINTTSFKTFKEDTNATISDDNFTSSPNAITETFKPTRSYDFKVNGFSNVIKSSNLLNLTDKADTTINGITYSIKDGVITLNGTSTETTFIPLISGLSGRYYSINGFNNASTDDLQILYAVNGVAWNTVDLGTANASRSIDFLEEQTNIEFNIRINPNTSLTNATIKPMLVSGSTIPSTFEPYFDPYIESFADKKNLLGFDDVEETTTTGGVTYSIKNGVFTLNGTSSKSHNIFINFKKPINSGIYSFNAFTTTGSRADIYLNAPLVPLASLAAPANTKSNISLTSATQLSVWFPKDEKYDNRTFKPMLVEGNKIPTTFLPYQDKYSAFLNVKGKNLFDKSQIREGYYGGVVNTDAGNYDSNYQTISPNKTYYISGTIGLFHALAVYDKQKNKISTLIANTTARTFTTPSNAYYYIYSSNTTNGGNVPNTIMISEGNTAPTEYEPYYSFTKEVLIKQPLRKFDYLTYDGVYRQTNEIVLDGTNNIYVEESSGIIQVLNIPNVDSLNTDWGINYASQLMVTTSNLPLIQSYLIQVEKQKGIGTNNGRIFIKLDDSADNSLNNWTVEKVNNYFKQNPITITYKTVDQTFEATSLTRLLFKNGYNKITAFDSINNNAIVEYLEYYKSKGD